MIVPAMEILLIAAFAITFVFLLKISGHTRQERFLEEVPGPGGYPIIGNFFDIFRIRRDFLRLTVENEAKFGCIYKSWIGSTPIVFISKPEYVEAMFAVKGTIRPTDRNSLITKSLKIHPFNCPSKRNLLASAINTTNPDSIIKITNDNCQTLLEALKSKLNEKDVLQYETVSLCLLDSICEIILGVKISSEMGENSSFAISLIQLIKILEENHKLRFYKDSLFKLTSYGKEYFLRLNLIREFIRKIVQDREGRGFGRESNSGADSTNILDDLLIYNGIYTIEDVQDEILNLIVSAFQSINPSVYSLLFVAGSRPNLQDNILRETEEALVKSQQNFITIKEMQKMMFLDRVIKETLRLFPPCPFIVKETERDAKIGNYLIPHGTKICIQLLNLQRDSNSFPNAENFDPDNFLQRNSKLKNRFSFMPFGIAESNCLGQKLAELIQRVIITNLIKTFVLETDQQWTEPFTSIESYIKQFNYEIKFRLALRSDEQKK